MNFNFFKFNNIIILIKKYIYIYIYIYIKFNVHFSKKINK